MKKTIYTLISLILIAICANSFSLTNPWQELQAGNQRFINDKAIHYDSISALKKYRTFQKPDAVILSCMDSRVPPEVLFNQNIGRLFIIRNAGNVEDKNVLASLEYATAIIHTPLIVVMGHTGCGAIKAACENVDFGHITQLVHNMQKAVMSAKKSTKLTDCNNPTLITAIVKANVSLQINKILTKSPIIDNLVKKGKVKIQGAYFNFKTGKVETLNI